ncbi:MAG: hypothetical protein H7281_08840 [Bacteriovorax sp.]|nr:hypothetical protein [Bacteriovorax sp.]
MKTISGILVMIMMVLFTACASTPYNPSKPEMSVPSNSTYKTPPTTFNKLHNDWEN